MLQYLEWKFIPSEVIQGKLGKKEKKPAFKENYFITSPL